MILLFSLFVILLNVGCIYVIYRFIQDAPAKEKFIVIAVGVAVMYIITLFAHWISTLGMEDVYTTGTLKDLVIFLFVPINGLIVLPTFVNSYYSFKNKRLDKNIFIKRIIILLIPLIIVFVLESVFLKNVQTVVTNKFGSTFSTTVEEETNVLEEDVVENNISNNTIEEDINETTNETTNELTNDTAEDENTVSEEENTISNTTDD